MSKGEDFFRGTQKQVNEMSDDELKAEFVECSQHSPDESNSFWVFRKSVVKLEAFQRNLAWSWDPTQL